MGFDPVDEGSIPSPWVENNGVGVRLLVFSGTPSQVEKLRSGLEWIPARSHKPYDVGSNPASAMIGTLEGCQLTVGWGGLLNRFPTTLRGMGVQLPHLPSL